ncbi:hypothetical protein RN001_016125 [Aquatica leii]|uniref:Uncharacterized protein n=1 Tax=Aquatica leii TaxID=1421715 RepID=A0AAN7P1B7_9COLE|nr:hypothetical protein RN001_016125 [Aquatica leii]
MNLNSARKHPRCSLDLNILVQFEACNNELKRINEQQEEEETIIVQNGDLEMKLLYNERENIIQAIPKFWYHTLLSNLNIKKLFPKIQKRCFRNLLSIGVDDLTGFSDGFRITFHFKSNPYFENTMLVKEIYPNQDPPSSSSCIIWNNYIDWTRSLDEPSCSFINAATFFEWYVEEKCANTISIAKEFKHVFTKPLMLFTKYIDSQNAQHTKKTFPVKIRLETQVDEPDGHGNPSSRE